MTHRQKQLCRAAIRCMLPTVLWWADITSAMVQAIDDGRMTQKQGQEILIELEDASRQIQQGRPRDEIIREFEIRHGLKRKVRTA